MANSAYAIPDQNDTDYTTVNWKGYIYQFDRENDGYIHVARTNVPVSTSTSSQEVTFGDIPKGDLDYEGLLDWYPGTIRDLGIGGNGVSFKVAPVAPIVFKTGAQTDFSDSLSLMYLRDTAGMAGAKFPIAWGSATFGETAKGTKVASGPFSIGTNHPERDFTGTLPEWQIESTTPQVGAAPLPDNSAVITAHAAPGMSGLRIGWWNFSWGGRGAGSYLNPEKQPALYRLPANINKDTWDGNVSIGISANADDAKADPNNPYQLWLTLHAKNGDIWVASARIGKSRSNLVLTWKKPFDGKNIAGLTGTTLVVDPAGRPEVLYSSVYNNTRTVSRIHLSGTASNFSSVQNANENRTDILSPSGKIPDVTYSFGPKVPSNTEAEVLVDAFANYWHVENAGKSKVTAVKHSMARRSAKLIVPPNAGQKYPVVGFFDGPPPMPNENLTELPPSAVDTVLGKVYYGNENTQTSETSIKGAVGPVFKTEGAAGAPIVGDVEYEAEGSFMVGYGTNSATENTLITGYTAQAKALQYAGKLPQLRSEGVVLLYKSGFSGYIYQMVDENKKAIPGTNSILQLTPYQPQIVPYSFAIDPAGQSGIIPGNLMSYLVDQPALDLLSKNSMLMPAPNGANFITTGWSSAGDTTQEINYQVESGSETSVDLDVQLMVGATAGDPELHDYMTAKAGVKATFSYEEKKGEKDERIMNVDVDTPMPTEAEGAYSSYSFSTFIEKADPSNGDRLMEILQYDDPHGLNKALRNLIAPGSEPWMVTYGVRAGDYFQIAPPEGGTGALEATAPKTGTATVASVIPASLQRRGITTPQQLGLLHVSVANLDKLRQAKRPLTALKGVPAPIHQTATTLTAQEKADLVTYVKAQQAKSFQAFLKAYPKWKPRTFARVATAAPAPAPAAAPAAAATPAKTTAPAQVNSRAIVLQAMQERAEAVAKSQGTLRTSAPQPAVKPVVVPALSPQSLKALQTP